MKRTRKGIIHDNTLRDKVIKEIASELNLPEDMVHRAVSHFFLWQRDAFNSLEYEEYLWNYFGTLSVLPQRYEEWINSDKYKQEQLNKNKNKNGEKSKNKEDKNT